MPSLGQRIKDVRKDKDWTQVDLAKAVGVDTQTVSNWETDRKSPQRGAFFRLANVLEVSATWLKTGQGSREMPAPYAPNISTFPAPILGTSNVSIKMGGHSEGFASTPTQAVVYQALSHLLRDLEDAELPIFLDAATRIADEIKQNRA